MIHDKIHEKHKFINKLTNQTLNLLQFITNLVLCVCVLFYSSFVCTSAYANVYFKTTIIKQNIKIILIAGVPSSQALPGFLITAPPSVCVPAVLGALTVWIQIQKKKKVKVKGEDPNTPGYLRREGTEQGGMSAIFNHGCVPLAHMKPRDRNDSLILI